MSRYRFELATPEDDADLRHVLAATPMAGRIAVTFHREPSWFAGAAVDGRFRQVIGCRDLQTGRIVGYGCRSLRDVFINGCPAVVGYLSSLRVLPEHRRRGLVARGYRKLKELHEDGRAPFYLTTIAVGNDTALDQLTSARAGLPAYHPAGEYHTMAIALARRPSRTTANGQLLVRPARTEDLPAVLRFLAAEGPKRQFFPRLSADDFLSPAGAFHGLSLDWLLLAERKGQIVGTLAGWDQHSFRQSIVESYHGGLHYLRPLYNAWSGLRGRPGLPPPGSAFRYLLAALPTVADNDQHVFAELLATLRQRAAGGPWTHLLVGLHSSDPLLHVAERCQTACYKTHLFLVCWPDGEQARAAVDGRTIYLEAGSL